MRDLQILLPQSRLDKGGKCVPKKRKMLHDIIASKKVTCAVEIGVLRGSTFLVLAEAMEEANHKDSKLYGIDPWDSEKAKNHIPFPSAEKAVAYLFEDQSLWEGMNQSLLFILKYADVKNPSCELIRAESTNVHHIHDVDLLHVDGNHDRADEDLLHWLPRMAPHGIIIMDDANWPAVSAAIETHLKPFADLLVNDDKVGCSVWQVR